MPRFEWGASLLCFGNKSDIAQLKEYFEEESPQYISIAEDFIEDFSISDIDHGDNVNTLIIKFPILYMRDVDEVFSAVVQKFKNVSFIAGGVGDAPESDDLIYTIYYAAKNGEVINSGAHEYDPDVYSDDDDVDGREAARETAERDFGEYFTDFLKDSVEDKLNLFSDKVVCKGLLLLCHKYTQIASCAYTYWHRFPADFWLDSQCEAQIPPEFWTDNFWGEQLDMGRIPDGFWESEAGSAILKNHPEVASFIQSEK